MVNIDRYDSMYVVRGELFGMSKFVEYVRGMS